MLHLSTPIKGEAPGDPKIARGFLPDAPYERNFGKANSKPSDHLLQTDNTPPL